MARYRISIQNEAVFFVHDECRSAFTRGQHVPFRVIMEPQLLVLYDEFDEKTLQHIKDWFGDKITNIEEVSNERT